MTAPRAAAPVLAPNASAGAPPDTSPDRRLRDRRLLIAAVSAVTTAAAILGAYATRQPAREIPLDTRTPTAAGALGVYEASARLGWRPARAELPLGRAEPRATYVAIRPLHGVRAADAGQLLAAVRAGAGLVVDVRNDGDALSDSLGLRVAGPRPSGWVVDNGRVAERVGAAAAIDREGCRQASVDASNGTEIVSFVLADSGRAAAGTPGVRVFFEVANAPGAGGTSHEDSLRSRAARDPAPALVGFPLGRGHVVAVSDAALFSNAALKTCWAAAGPAVVRALEWVSPTQAGRGRGALVFLEGRRAAAGDDAEPSTLAATWRALTTVPAGRAAAQALGAALVLLAALAARPVPPLAATRVQRRSPREYVGALAAAYRGARATRLVARRLARGLRRRHGGPGAGAGPLGSGRITGAAPAAAAGDDELAFLAAVAARHPALADDARRLADAARTPVAPSALAAVGEAAARLDAALDAARRGRA